MTMIRTVGDLRRLIEELPDDLPVAASAEAGQVFTHETWFKVTDVRSASGDQRALFIELDHL